MGNSIDYSKYKMSTNEKMTGFLLGFVISFLYINLIFHKAVFAMIVAAFAGLFYLKKYGKKCIKKRDEKITKQFKDLMESLVSSYSSGGNHVTAFEAAYEDMCELYGKDAYMVREIETINTGIRNGFTMDALLKDMARRIGNEDISNFVDVFTVCMRHGGDMTKVLYDTRLTIIEKLEMEGEIKVSLRAGNNEFMILIFVPIFIDLFMQTDSSMSAACNTLIGVFSRLIAVILCLIGYKIGRKTIQRVEKIFN